jgi:hypothetical protein
MQGQPRRTGRCGNPMACASASGPAFLPAPALVHEALEFLAVPGAAKSVQILAKLSLGRGYPLIFLFEPRKFRCTPFIEGGIPG